MWLDAETMEFARPLRAYDASGAEVAIGKLVAINIATGEGRINDMGKDGRTPRLDGNRIARLAVRLGVPLPIRLVDADGREWSAP